MQALTKLFKQSRKRRRGCWQNSPEVDIRKLCGLLYKWQELRSNWKS